MIYFLTRLFRGKKPPEVHPDQVGAGAILGEYAEAVAGDSAEYRGETNRSVAAPIAPRDERVSFAKLEAAPAERTLPLAATPPAARERKVGVAKDPDTSPIAGSDDKGWDLLRDDNW